MRPRTWVVLCLALLYPATAGAWDWWEYVDKLSGPGPFKNRNPLWTEFRVWTWDGVGLDTADQKFKAVFKDDPVALKWLAVVRLGGFDNDHDLQLFQDQPNDRRHVDLLTVDVAVMRRIAPVVDLGVGAVYFRFTGDRFEPINRLGVAVPRLTLTPFALIQKDGAAVTSPWSRVLKFYIDGAVLKGFTGRDFGNTSTSFSTRAEYLARYGFTLDFMAVAGGLAR